jgi:tetratricopeptide (TPR) repeat protein
MATSALRLDPPELVRRHGAAPGSVAAVEADDPVFLTIVGASRVGAGDIAGALELFRQALERDPLCVRAWAELARVPDFTIDEAVVEKVRAIPSRRSLDDSDRALWAYALAKMLDRRGDYDEAWHWYETANAAMRRLRPYDRAVDVAHLDAVQRVMTKEFFSERSALASSTRLPIFVFGLPRSGTTLVEQILASHPAVRGGGEMFVIPSAVIDVYKLARPQPYVQTLGSLPAAAWQEQRDRVQGIYEATAGEHQHLTDKLPGNYRHLGFIAVMLPNARFVHVHRDPIDVCVSNFTVMYAAGHPYANDLASLVTVWSDYRAMMDHWGAVAPITIHHVRYEDLVRDQEAVSRALLDHCGLGWDDRCLTFHQNPRYVATGSNLQVRQPMYTSAVGSWHRFAPHLGRLRADLAAAGAPVQ